MGTKRKQKGYSLNPLNLFSDDWDFNPRGVLDIWDKERKKKRELKVIKGLLAKEKEKGQNRRLGILEHDEDDLADYTEEEIEVLLKIATKGEGDSTNFASMQTKPEFGGDEVWDEELYAGMLASEELDGFKTYDQADHALDQMSDDSFYSNEQDVAREDHLLRRGAESPISGGMTDNAFASKSSKVSPAMAKYAVGLLKDFMTPAQDDPPQQVRGAGISRGGGTPFPSLLAKKQKPPRYTPKGLI